MLAQLTSTCLFCLVISQVFGIPQEVLVYDGTNLDNSNFYIRSTFNEPDLISYTSLNMTNDVPHYLCKVGGLTTYTGVNFTGSVDPLPYTTNITCTLITPGTYSVRFAGLLDDALAPTLNFYSEIAFIGNQSVLAQNITSISYPFQSIYKTGNEPWTLFTATAYTGFSICIRSTATVDIRTTGASPGEIRSARSGCDVATPEVFPWVQGSKLN